ncbi:MAG: hypothetical protein IJ467_07340 [Bacteroidaceae bacterium]|nr:hypothetical protein [Bacteroidaceae bacterium]
MLNKKFWVILGVIVLVFLLLWWLYMGMLVEEDESLSTVELFPLWSCPVDN